ncbi:MAG TPA: DNA polymerase ligase N-terminal domain-containing protein, partial [Chitinophaga sp.]|uniref:DNA polymerase ligase N-terminal domain-containing protein n=1 Tax=Chitinophaga sp. TaxID=1869181 RepID=UPI002F95D546
MALEKYKQKRSFNQTPEPTGGKSRGGKLIFVVQKHDASHLHYDFRLEMGGVLKSWAVPKGPSLNPADKRLAMMVEDHPFDYKDFEGVIPKGNYGAGTVIVWDHGTYEPIVPVKSRVEAEKQLLKQLKAGSLKVNLHGQKLNGEFALVHTHGRGENSWLLIKHRDKYSSDQDVTLKDKSVISGKTLAKMEKAPDKIYGRKTIPPGTTEKDRPSANRKKAVEKINKVTSVTAVKKTAKKPAVSKVDLSDAPRSSFPKTIRPMLATLVDKPVDQEGWLYEIKWDGYRAVALCNGSNVEIISRNNKPFNEKFYPVHEALQQLGLKAVLDGEIAVLRDTGITSFGDLQNWRSEADGELVYYVFDLLWLNGHNLMELPLIRRRELLHEVLPKEGIIRESESFETTATEFY